MGIVKVGLVVVVVWHVYLKLTELNPQHRRRGCTAPGRITDTDAMESALNGNQTEPQRG